MASLQVMGTLLVVLAMMVMMMTPPLCSPTECHYVDNNRMLLSFTTMCIGALDNDGLVLIDPDATPWNKLPKKHIKVASDVLCVEIKQRWETLSMEDKVPASKNWDKDELMKWLEGHPITTADDVAFLQHEVNCWKR
jgi:hypothetical protein